MNDVQNHVQRLRSLDCCAVSDALDRLKLPGVISGVPQRSGTCLIAGSVITMKLGKIKTQTSSNSTGQQHLGTSAIDASGPEHVIVIEQKTGIEAGCWGGLLTLGAKVRDINGVIADGPVRDIDEARKHSFPIFSSSLTALTARGRIEEVGTNVPITVWGQSVNPGDYVIADNSSIIFISHENINQVLDAAEIIAAKESAMAESISKGIPISEVLNGNYENMLKS